MIYSEIDLSVVLVLVHEYSSIETLRSDLEACSMCSSDDCNEKLAMGHMLGSQLLLLTNSSAESEK